MVGDLDPAGKCVGMIQHNDSMHACQLYIFFLGEIERPSMHVELERPLVFFLECVLRTHLPTTDKGSFCIIQVDEAERPSVNVELERPFEFFFWSDYFRHIHLQQTKEASL